MRISETMILLESVCELLFVRLFQKIYLELLLSFDSERVSCESSRFRSVDSRTC